MSNQPATARMAREFAAIRRGLTEPSERQQRDPAIAIRDLRQSAVPRRRLGRAVRLRRISLGLTQIAVGKASGISNETVSDIERMARSRLSPEVFARLDAGLGWAPGTAVCIFEGAVPETWTGSFEAYLLGVTVGADT